jgi:hypothetical protein
MDGSLSFVPRLSPFEFLRATLIARPQQNGSLPRLSLGMVSVSRTIGTVSPPRRVEP